MSKILFIVLMSSVAVFTPFTHVQSMSWQGPHHHQETPDAFSNFQNTTMKNTITGIIMLALMMLSLQSAFAQGGYSRLTQEQLDNIAEVKREVDEGKITKANWESSGRFQRGIITETLDSEQRKNAISSAADNDNDKKALIAAYDGLAKSLSKQGISYEEPMDQILKFLYDQLVATNESVKQYKPGDLFMVSGSEKDWLLRAISKKEYDKWIADSRINWVTYPAVNKKNFDEGFANLKASAAKQIPLFKPNAKNFANENAADLALIKKQIDATSVSIHRIGFAQADWEIQKDELKVPEKRFKVGYVWGKDSRDDFAYCRLYQINVIQEYEGGGKYGKSYAVLLDSWIVGCP